MRSLLGLTILTFLAGLAASGNAQDKAGPKDNTPPEGFTALFNGKDLTGWQGLSMVQVEDSAGKKRTLPLWLSKLSPEEKALKQKEANDKILKNWTVTDGILAYDAKSNSLQTVKNYGNFELLMEWKIAPKGDSGLYLRGQPQVQMWDPEVAVPNKGVGSGGLFNNQKNPKEPLKNADKAPGEWNNFRIVMKGDKVTIWLNGEKVVDDTVLENYWDRGQPLPAKGPIELQHHGNPPSLIWVKNVYIKELPD